MGLLHRPRRCLRRRYVRRAGSAASVAVFAAVRGWMCEEPLPNPDGPGAAGVHAELRVAARLTEPTDA